MPVFIYILIGFCILGLIATLESVRDSIGDRKDRKYDHVKRFNSLPEAIYKDFNLWDKTKMAFLPTHLWRDHQPDDDDLKILSMNPGIKIGRESEGITCKLYKGHKVLIKRVKLHENNSPF